MQSALFFFLHLRLDPRRMFRPRSRFRQPADRRGRQAQNQQHNLDHHSRRRTGRVAALPARRGRGRADPLVALDHRRGVAGRGVAQQRRVGRARLRRHLRSLRRTRRVYGQHVLARWRTRGCRADQRRPAGDRRHRHVVFSRGRGGLTSDQRGRTGDDLAIQHVAVAHLRPRRQRQSQLPPRLFPHFQ